MAVDYQQAMYAYYTMLRMPIKVLQPLNTQLISRLAILAQRDSLFLWYIMELSSIVVLSSKYNKRQNRPALRVYTLNYYNLFSITQLYSFRPAASLRAYNNFSSRYNTYLKSSFIKIVQVFVKYAILRLKIAYQVKLGLDNPRILVQSSLIVVLLIIL